MLLQAALHLHLQTTLFLLNIHCGHRKPQRTILESYDTSITVNREFLASTFVVMLRVSSQHPPVLPAALTSPQYIGARYLWSLGTFSLHTIHSIVSSELGWTPAQSLSRHSTAEVCGSGAAIDKQRPNTRNPICLLSYRSLYLLIKAPARDDQDKVCPCIIVDSSKSNLI